MLDCSSILGIRGNQLLLDFCVFRGEVPAVALIKNNFKLVQTSNYSMKHKVLLFIYLSWIPNT